LLSGGAKCGIESLCGKTPPCAKPPDVIGKRRIAQWKIDKSQKKEIKKVKI
jgi:hypothetical protein